MLKHKRWRYFGEVSVSFVPSQSGWKWILHSIWPWILNLKALMRERAFSHRGMCCSHSLVVVLIAVFLQILNVDHHQEHSLFITKLKLLSGAMVYKPCEKDFQVKFVLIFHFSLPALHLFSFGSCSAAHFIPLPSLSTDKLWRDHWENERDGDVGWHANSQSRLWNVDGAHWVRGNEFTPVLFMQDVPRDLNQVAVNVKIKKYSALFVSLPPFRPWKMNMQKALT